MLKYIVIFVLFTLTVPVFATGDSVHVVVLGDAFSFNRDDDESAYIIHQVERKQTLFSICKFYGVSIKELEEINPILKIRLLQIDDELRIPYQAKSIQFGSPVYPYVPVVYEVSEKEGLFSVSKATNLKIEEIRKINNLKDDQISYGQKLIVGWIPVKKEPLAKSGTTNKFYDKTAGETKIASAAKVKAASVSHKDVAAVGNTVSKSAKTTTKEITAKKDNTKVASTRPTVKPDSSMVKAKEPTKKVDHNKNYYDKTAAKSKKVNSQGIAFWHRELKGSKGLYVLHRNAPINSIVAISNPMFNSTIYAKVLGNISGSVYPPDIMIVVSPEVAQQLGAKDERFFTKIAYFGQ